MRRDEVQFDTIRVLGGARGIFLRDERAETVLIGGIWDGSS